MLCPGNDMPISWEFMELALRGFLWNIVKLTPISNDYIYADFNNTVRMSRSLTSNNSVIISNINHVSMRAERHVQQAMSGDTRRGRVCFAEETGGDSEESSQPGLSCPLWAPWVWGGWGLGPGAHQRLCRGCRSADFYLAFSWAMRRVFLSLARYP